MRPYLVLCAVVLISALAFGQQPVPQLYGPCLLGCGPFVPLVTTPMVSLETVSPNPVGARNATTGLVAGATNSTLSQLSGSTSSEYTVPVWYQGGAPLTTSAVNLFPEPVGRAMREMRPTRSARGLREEAAHEWMYYVGREHKVGVVAASVAAKSGRKATHEYNNVDVERQNDNNGIVKYGGKTEKM